MADTPKTPEQPIPVPPKKRKRTVVSVVLIIIVLAVLLPVSNLFVPPVKDTVLTRAAEGSDEHVAAMTLLEANCLDCHSRDTALPFYSNFPIAGSLIAADRKDGLVYIDMMQELVPDADGSVPEVGLAKLEYVIEHNTMPPGRYLAMHWNRGLSAQDNETLLNWIRKTRKGKYATEGVAAAFQADVLQPVPTTMPADAKKVALGNKLYHDKRLSGDDTLSCASCHALDKGGTDQAKSSTGIKNAIGPINSPTVYNAVFNFVQFWDGRAEDLQDQAGGPVANPIEMGSSFEQVVPKLSQDGAFVDEFKAVYPEGLSQETITHAIAEFEKTLITPNSRFDQYLKGQADALNADELAGLKLFRDNACANCHAGKALGGQSFEKMGRAKDYFADRGNVTDVDKGRFNVTRNEDDLHRFKVPTLRNIAVTFPYFHDGSQATLASAVKSMSTYQTHRPFSDAEVEKVVAFLKTLTGEYQGQLLK